MVNRKNSKREVTDPSVVEKKLKMVRDDFSFEIERLEGVSARTKEIVKVIAKIDSPSKTLNGFFSQLVNSTKIDIENIEKIKKYFERYNKDLQTIVNKVAEIREEVLRDLAKKQLAGQEQEKANNNSNNTDDDDEIPPPFDKN